MEKIFGGRPVGYHTRVTLSAIRTFNRVLDDRDFRERKKEEGESGEVRGEREIRTDGCTAPRGTRLALQDFSY